ncbi:hypothetical protein K501DRAFT_335173 [Backusella circina FSU 941]|nr:hypothetical protein K501DRAFT_335173 [Backusella circina FSU 941]
MDTRHNQLVVLSKRVKETNDKLNIILEKLGWTREELRQHITKRQCPFNKQHVVTEKNFKEHYRRCLLKSRNVSTRQPKLPPSSIFFYKNTKNIVSFTSNNYITTPLRQSYFVEELAPPFTTAEKRAEYDAMIEYKRRMGVDHQHATWMNSMDFIMSTKEENNNNNNKSRMIESDSKRRPKQYRGKMKSMTPTEIQRELINGFMQEF